MQHSPIIKLSKKRGFSHDRFFPLRYRIRPATYYLIAGIGGLIVGIYLAVVINNNLPEESTISVPRAEIIEPVYASETAPSGEIGVEVPKVEAMKTAIVTAYSCGGLKTEAEIEMNCPSLKNYPNGRTSTGTTPRPYITVACDQANTGRKFYLDGIGEVVCEDTGGAIKGAGRFDLYVTDVQEAREFGRQEIKYREVK